MDLQQYISSGIIEAYVLGIASDEDVRKLELLSAQYPELAAGIEAQQQVMEDFASLYALSPPEGLKEPIWERLEQQHSSTSLPSPTTQHPDRISHNPPAANRTKGLYRPLAAAAALLAISLIFNVVHWQQARSAEKELAAVKSEQEKIIAGNRDMQQQMDQANRHMQMMLNPEMKAVRLVGVGPHTANHAMVMWDTRTNEVFLSLKDLPRPPDGMQYQLWAMVDGKPVDAGLWNRDSKEMMQKMKVIASAQMFAITLEKQGGSPTPTMTELYVAGKT